MTDQQHRCASPGCPGDARWRAQARDGDKHAEVWVCALHLAYLHCLGRLTTYEDTRSTEERRRA